MLQTCEILLNDYKRGTRATNPKKLNFEGISGYDVYNPSIPFKVSNKTIMIGRVEKRESEHSEVVFFTEISKNYYKVIENMKRYGLQDPFIAYINNKWILGGTEIFSHPDNPNNLWWRTAFYYGDNIDDLTLLTYGPNGMKDIRLIELPDSRIGVFTRPQGDIGGRGKIGFTVIDSLNDLNPANIEAATILNQFNHEEWGGVNQAILLENGMIGVIGHIARFSKDGKRHYYSMAFTLNPVNLNYSAMKIIAIRDDFLDGEAKRDDLKDVIFSAGIENDNGKYLLYVGVSDVECQVIEIENPFVI